MDFISSLAAGAMIAAAHEMKQHGGTTRIIHARPLVLDLLQVTRLDDIFEIEK